MAAFGAMRRARMGLVVTCLILLVTSLANTTLLRSEKSNDSILKKLKDIKISTDPQVLADIKLNKRSLQATSKKLSRTEWIHIEDLSKEILDGVPTMLARSAVELVEEESKRSRMEATRSKRAGQLANASDSNSKTKGHKMKVEKPDEDKGLMEYIAVLRAFFKSKETLAARFANFVFLDMNSFQDVTQSKIAKSDSNNSNPANSQEAKRKKKPKPGSKKAQVTDTHKVEREVKKELDEKHAEHDISRMRFDANKSLKKIGGEFWFAETSTLMSIVAWAMTIFDHYERMSKQRESGTLLQSEFYQDENEGYEFVQKLKPLEDSVIIDCLMSLTRAIIAFQDIVAPLAITHARKILQHFSEFAGSTFGDDMFPLIFEKYPIFLHTCTFQDLTRKQNLKPYSEQAEVLRACVTSVRDNKPLLACYKVPPSGGKTVLALGIAAALGKLQEMRLSKKRLLYCCYNPLVRNSVCAGALSVGQAVPFWIATSETDQGGKIKTAIRPHFSCWHSWRDAQRTRLSDSLKKQVDFFSRTTDSWAPLIVADPVSAINLIREFGDEFVVYLDEPTAGSEYGTEDNAIAEYYAELCANLPRVSVLLSATLPDNIRVRWPSLAESFQKRHPHPDSQSSIREISSERIPVGCQVTDPHGKIWLPHQLYHTCASLKAKLPMIQGEPSLKRMYTPMSVLRLANLTHAYLPTSLRFREYFGSKGKGLVDLNHDKVRAYAMEVLTHVANSGNDSLVATIACDHPSGLPAFKLDTLLTKDAHNYRGTSLLVASSSGLKRVVTKAFKAIDDVAPDVNHIVDDQLNRVEQAEAAVRKAQSSRKRHGEEQMDMEDAQYEMQEIDWPDNLVVNSIEHAKKFSGLHAVMELEPKRHRVSIDVRDADTIRGYDSQALKQLLCGVGMYSPLTQSETVVGATLDLMEDGDISHFMSDPSIVYGTNLPLHTVIIDHTYSKTATYNSMLQLMGRAGRTGKTSWANVVFTEFEDLKRCLNPAKDSDSQRESNTLNILVDRAVRRSMAERKRDRRL